MRRDGDVAVFDRIWIDHVPRNDRDTVQVFAAITDWSVQVSRNRDSYG